MTAPLTAVFSQISRNIHFEYSTPFLKGMRISHAQKFEVERTIAMRRAKRSQAEIGESLGRPQPWVSRLLAALRESGVEGLETDLRKFGGQTPRFKSAGGVLENV